MGHILLQKKFNELQKTTKLFRSKLSGEKLWSIYLSGFGIDPVFRDPSSSEHNCNCCGNFIKRYGNVVALDKNYDIITMFDDSVNDPEYGNSFKLMSEALKKEGIENIFIESWSTLNSLPYEKGVNKTQATYRLGLASNKKIYTEDEAKKFGVVQAGKVYTFNHFHLDLNTEFVEKRLTSIPALMAMARAEYQIFKTGLDKLSTNTLTLVKDLIKQGSLLDGNAQLGKVEEMIKKSKEYAKIDKDHKDNWCWLESRNVVAPRFANELIGVLCDEIERGEVGLNRACQNWNKRVDPANYMKVEAPITQQMINDAKKFVQDNGYEQSFTRRCATLEDIKVHDILHSNVGDGKVKQISIFDNLKPTGNTKAPDFSKVQEVNIKDFIANVLPGCTSVEAFLENRLEKNLVTLTTSCDKDSKRIFKWDNNFSWTYNGNLAGKSQITQTVKSKGGFVDAPFRFSIMWNEDKEAKYCDLDAHAIESDKTEIYFRSYKDHKTGMSGMLDIDVITPGDDVAVENIFWTDMKKIKDGEFKFFVHNYNDKSNKGFKAEIYIDGQTFSYHCKVIYGTVDVAKITMKDGRLVKIEHNNSILTGGNSGASKVLYNLDTQKFHKVNLVCTSPNHWENEVGNKHYFFMMEDCKSPTSLRTFHNENLKPELLKHRKVFDILGNTIEAESVDGQLSGLGFDETVKDSLIVRLKGSFDRVVKIKF